MMRSGANRSLRRWLACSVLLLGLPLLSACLYGFSAGSLPRDLRTVAVLPFDNMTPVPEVQLEIFEAMRKAMNDRLNLRDAPADRADVLVTGEIKEYDVDLPVGVASDPQQATSARRQLRLVVSFEIVNQKTGELLKRQEGAPRLAQYPEGGEARGRKDAIDQMINELIDDMLSQW